MQNPFLLKLNPATHPLASRLSNGKVIDTPGGRLRIEGEEAQMDALMSEVNAAYYDGIVDISKVDVVVAPVNNPLPEALSAIV